MATQAEQVLVYGEQEVEIELAEMAENELNATIHDEATPKAITAIGAENMEVHTFENAIRNFPVLLNIRYEVILGSGHSLQPLCAPAPFSPIRGAHERALNGTGMISSKLCWSNQASIY